MSNAARVASRYLKRNFTFNTFDGIFFFLGMIFLHLENVLPVYISKLGGSNFVISLIPVLHNMGIFFPAIFVANYLQSLKRKQPYLLRLGMVQRTPWLIAGCLSFFFADSFPTLIIIVLLSTVFIAAIISGMNIPAFFYFTAKTIPMQTRGKLFALRNMGSYLLGLAAGGLIRYLMSHFDFPRNFSMLLLIGFCFIMLSQLSLALIKEPESEVTTPRMKLRDFLKTLPEKLKRNPSFIAFAVGRALYSLAYTSCSYFSVNLVRTYNLNDSEVGIFAIINAATFIIINPLLGFLGDKYGHKTNMIIGSCSLVVGNLVALFSHNYILSLVSISMAAVALSVRIVSGFTMTIEFCEQHEIPTYIGMTGLFAGCASLPIAVLGMMANKFNLPVLFAVCLCVGIVMIVNFTFFVKEPRKHPEIVKPLRRW